MVPPAIHPQFPSIGAKCFAGGEEVCFRGFHSLQGRLAMNALKWLVLFSFAGGQISKNGSMSGSRIGAKPRLHCQAIKAVNQIMATPPSGQF
jgi:hypothetical protein